MPLNPPSQIDRRGLQPLANADGSHDSDYPLGDKPTGGGGDPASGGTAALSWSASSGLSDGNTITLTTDGTYTLTPPDRYLWLGFGQGWLYDNPLGTEATDVTVNGENLQYSKSSNESVRKITEAGGIRYLESTLADSSVAQSAAVNSAGDLYWDTGAAITNNDAAFICSLSSCSEGTVAGADFQWKQQRYKSRLVYDNTTEHELYYTFTGTASGGWGRFLGRRDSGSDSSAEFPATKQDSNLRYFGNVWVPNTPDVDDGYVAAHKTGPDDTYSVDLAPTNSSGGELGIIVESDSSDRPQFMLFQDFLGNNTNDTRNVILRRTDIYMKLNGVLFLLGDAASPANCTSLVPLVPEATSTTEWTCRLWKQTMANYAGKHILLFDERLVFIDSVAL